MWCRYDSKTGYLLEFNLYLGKKNETKYGLGTGVVVQLIQKLENLFSLIYIDNFLIHHHYRLHALSYLS